MSLGLIVALVFACADGAELRVVASRGDLAVAAATDHVALIAGTSRETRIARLSDGRAARPHPAVGGGTPFVAPPSLGGLQPPTASCAISFVPSSHLSARLVATGRTSRGPPPPTVVS